MARKKRFPAASMAKYEKGLKLLEEEIMKPGVNGCIPLSMAQFLKKNGLAACLNQLFIKSGWIQRLNRGVIRVLKPHEFQRLARNPGDAVEMVYQYNMTKRWARNAKEDKFNPDLPKLGKKEFYEKLEGGTLLESDNEIPSEQEIKELDAESRGLPTYAQEVSNRADVLIKKVHDKLQSYLGYILNPLDHQERNVFRDLKVGDIADPMYPSSSLHKLKTLFYPAYLKEAKKELDSEFKEFMKWKESQKNAED